MTLKDYHDFLKEANANGVKNVETFKEILPRFIEALSQTKWSWKNARAMQEQATKLGDTLAEFVLTHPSVSKELPVSPDGVRSFDVTVNNTVYHLSCGFDGYVRTDGEKLTQNFLATLDKGWTKGKLELDITGMKRSDVTGEEIIEAGLVQKPKNIWTEAEVY